MYWWDKLLDVSQSLRIKHGQNSIHSAGYQTTARQSETQIRLSWWRGYTFSDDVTCLGVVFDNELKLSTHIKRLAGKCFYHLRQMRSVRRSLSVDAAKTLINPFITSYHSNSVVSRVAVTHLRPLQSVLNAAARLIVEKRNDPIIATIRDVLHWLPIQQRIEYKLCDIVYKTMHRTAPVDLTEQCSCVFQQHMEIWVQRRTMAQPMVARAVQYDVQQRGTRYRCRSVNNLSVSDSFAVVSRRNYLIELIMLLIWASKTFPKRLRGSFLL